MTKLGNITATKGVAEIMVDKISAMMQKLRNDEEEGKETRAEKVELCPLTKEEIEEELNEVDRVKPAWREEHDGFIRVTSVFDSGAAECVAPPTMAPYIPVQPSEGSRNGQHYRCAGKTRIPNQGEQVLHAVTKEYNSAALTYQIADVSRPLTAAGTTCDKGNAALLLADGGLIVNLTTGMTTEIERRNGIYELDFWIREDGGDPRVPGFTRRGS